MDFIISFLTQYGYWGMLLAAFLAGSFFPFSSEAVMIGLMATGLDPWVLMIYGTIGNVLGSIVNYCVGRMGRMEWIEKYGSIWREERESLEKNGFISQRVEIKHRCGAYIDTTELATIAHTFGCDIYIHKNRMEQYNFTLFSKKKYLNVRSILTPKFLEAFYGETIELIATGSGAKDALEASVRLLNESPPCFPVKD